MSLRGSDENLYSATSDSFWDVGNYKRTVKRTDDGAKLCDDFMKLVTERAEIEAKYSLKLKTWAKKWEELIKNGPEYASMETAMRGTVSEAEARSELHMQCRDRLMQNVNEALKKWKQENYHKGIFQWKETKEAEDGFAKAQKPWAKRLAKVMKARKAYHAASRATEEATKRENEVSQDAEKSEEKKKKLQEATEKARREMERCKEKYQVRLDEITAYNSTYEQDMRQEFKKCQTSEEIRLDFFKESLVNYHRCLNISESPELTRMFANMIETFEKAQTEQCLDWWSKNHGEDMPQYWPVFEQLSSGNPRQKADANPSKASHLKRQQKKGVFQRLFQKHSEESDEDEHLDVEQEDMQYEVVQTGTEVDSGSCCSTEKAALALDTANKEGSVGIPPASSDVVNSKTQLQPMACSSPLYCAIEDTFASQQQYNVTTGTDLSCSSSPLYCTIGDISHSIRTEPAGTGRNPVGDPVAESTGMAVDLDAGTLAESSSPYEEHDDPPLSRRPTLNKAPKPSATSDTQAAFTTNSMVYGGISNHVEDVPVYQDSDQFSPGTPLDYTYDSPSQWDNEPAPAPPIDNNVGVPVRALYDFEGQEQDELTFKEGDIITKLSESDDQGWCQGRFNGVEGHFPDAYVEPV